jgi:hypothetical protein
VNTGSNLAESSKEGYGLKSAVSSMMMMMVVVMIMMNRIYYDRLSNLELHYKQWDIIIIIYLNCKWVLPGVSGTTIGQHTNNTHHTK